MHARAVREEPRRVGQRGHLDHRFRPVHKRGQHSGTHAAGRRLFGDALRGRGPVEPVVLALPGADDFEPGRACPIDQFGDQRGLVAPADGRVGRGLGASSCPRDLTACNGWVITEIGLRVFEPAA